MEGKPFLLSLVGKSRVYSSKIVRRLFLPFNEILRLRFCEENLRQRDHFHPSGEGKCLILSAVATLGTPGSALGGTGVWFFLSHRPPQVLAVSCWGPQSSAEAAHLDAARLPLPLWRGWAVLGYFPTAGFGGCITDPSSSAPTPVPASLLCELTVFPQEEEHISLPKLWPRDSLWPVN